MPEEIDREIARLKLASRGVEIDHLTGRAAEVPGELGPGHVAPATDGDRLTARSMRAMVMAAGLGTRLRPLTYEIAKPLVPVANRPVMEHILLLLRRHGFGPVIANLHWFADTIRDRFGDGSATGDRPHLQPRGRAAGHGRRASGTWPISSATSPSW